MANKKITDLTEITSAADVDVLAIVDVSADTTNKIKVDNLPVSAPVQTALDAKQATLVSGTNIKTINSTSLLGSGDIAISANPAGTDGQIQFNSSSAFGADSNLYWDNTNKRLGVGTSSPTGRISILADDTINFGTRATISGNSTLNGIYIRSGTGSLGIGASGNEYTATIGGGLVGIGLGTTTPTARLHVKGSGSTSATTSLLVQNSSGTDLLKVQDNGQLNVGGSVSRINSDSNDLLVTSGNMRFSGVANFGIGNYPSTSAILQADSTTRGFLPPRMTTTQKNAISSPAAGLQLYDSTTNRAAVYTSAWENVITETNGSPNSVYKLWSGSAAQYAALTPDSSTLYFVI